MAGLESIALAVAHLERMQDDSEEKDGEKQTESNSKESPPPSSPFQQSQARMVSSDQRPDKALDKDKQKDGTADSATANTLVSEAEAIAEQAAGAAAAVATTHRHNFDVSTGTEPKDASAANAADPAETKDLLGMPLAPMEREKAEPSSSKGRRGKTPEGKPRSQWGMSLSRTTGKRGPNGELIDEGPVASLVAKLSVVTDNLELYFGLMDQVKALAEGTAAPLPKPEDPVPRVQVNDVLLGRGGETNHHVGNIEYRRLVKASQPAYLAAKRRDKPRIAASIVQVVRARSGKFLKKMPGDNNWHDVGNNRAREKTSQALREGAPELRSFVQASKQASADATGTPSLVVPPNVCDRHRQSIHDVVAMGEEFCNHHQVANALHALSKAHWETSDTKSQKTKKHKTNPPDSEDGFAADNLVAAAEEGVPNGMDRGPVELGLKIENVQGV